MSTAADLVAQLRAIDARARAELAGPLSALEAIPDDPPVSGADPSKVDWEHVITGDQKPTNGQRYRQCVIDGRLLRGGWDAHLEDVVVTGGSTILTSPRPIAEFAAGAMLERVTIAPKVRSVMWSDGVRTNGPAYSRGLKITGTVDGLGVVTPVGTRTDGTHVDLDVSDLPWFATDPNQRDGSHNDCVQLHGLVDGFRLIRPHLDAGPKGTSCVMANVASVKDFTIDDGSLSGGRSGVNFGPTAIGLRVAIVDTRFACPVDVYATDPVFKALRLDRSTRADGSPATRTKS